MIKIDIMDTIREKIGFTKVDTAKIVESVFDIIKEALQREDKVMISGFGSFVARKKGTRRGRNPRTGSDMEIGPRRVLTFKPSSILSTNSNRPEESREESDIVETTKEVE